jgi:RNA polymerase sigma-70 factor (ECF subfamily)
MDDAALVRHVLAGNTESYSDLVQHWAGRVTAFCHARLGRADLAEELAQETLVRGFEELSSLADPVRFGPWLLGIASNTCRDWLKSHQNGQIHFSALPNGPPIPAGGPDPLEEAQRSDEIARLMRLVETLPEEFRVVLMLFYAEKSSYRDIANLLDVSPATVNARLTKARALLRARMARSQPSFSSPPDPARPEALENQE